MSRDVAQLTFSSIILPVGSGRGNSGRFTALDPDKLRGGYYTPPGLASWLCRWAIRSTDDVILEPSCGDGAFLDAALSRMAELGGNVASRAKRLVGIEVIADEASKAKALLHRRLGSRGEHVVVNDDFFAWYSQTRQARFDAVVGNPPFIRYQSFPEPHRSVAMGIMQQLGLVPNKLTNIWVPFVVASVATLREGGRLALVLPAELLQVTYASQLRSFLTDRFERIDLVACNELFFDNAQQEVILLLADGARTPGPTEDAACRVRLSQSKTVAEILERSPEEVFRDAEPKTVRHATEKWLKYFLTETEIGLMRELRASGRATTLADFASVDVGVVTGKNQFFVLTQTDIRENGLEHFTVPLVSRSAHLAGAHIGKKEWRQLASNDELVQLLHLAPVNGGKLPPGLAKYIRGGESAQVHTGYKCSIREPWYAVPAVWTPDAFLFRQIYDFPRAVLNKAGATSTDTIHRMRVTRPNDPGQLVGSLYTHLTAASAEIEGRSYGGGVLELEPNEAERLLVPARLDLALSVAECDQFVREGRLEELLEENDRRVLIDGMGLSKRECRMLRDIWQKMRDRRIARRRAARPKTT